MKHFFKSKHNKKGKKKNKQLLLNYKPNQREMYFWNGRGCQSMFDVSTQNASRYLVYTKINK